MILSTLENMDSEQYDIIIELLLLDYYKINVFMESYDSLEIFKYSKEELIERTLYDEEFLILLINSSFVFNELCILSKIIVLEKIGDIEQDKNLMKFSKLHLFDKISYTFEYNLDSFKEYYLDFKNKYNRNPRKMDVSYFIATKLIDYKDIRYDEFQKMVLEFIKVYYKWNVFVRDNCPEKSLNKDDYSYLNLITKNKIGPLIEYISKNIDFLTSIIDSYLFYLVGEREISEEIVDNYFYKTVDEETQKKLKLKRD